MKQNCRCHVPLFKKEEEEKKDKFFDEFIAPALSKVNGDNGSIHMPWVFLFSSLVIEMRRVRWRFVVLSGSICLNMLPDKRT